MTEQERTELMAAETFLDLTDTADWHLLHATIRERVRAGELSQAFEGAYRQLVDRIAPP